MKYCENCGFEFPGESEVNCPSCGKPLLPLSSKWDGGMDVVYHYLNQVKMILLHPSNFYRSLERNGDLAGPIAFAIITHWIGVSVAFLWQLLVGGAMQGILRNAIKNWSNAIPAGNGLGLGPLSSLQDQLLDWFWSAGSIAVDPFFTLFSILYHSLFIFVAARILVFSSEKVKFSSTVRTVCYGMTPVILAAVPIFGTSIAYFYTIIVTIIGIRETYQISSVRAAIIALFPFLLFFGIIGIGILIFIASIFSLVFGH